MNKIYKVVKNRATGLYTVVSELAKGASKGSSSVVAALLAVLALSTGAQAANPDSTADYDLDSLPGKTMPFTLDSGTDTYLLTGKIDGSADSHVIFEGAAGEQPEVGFVGDVSGFQGSVTVKNASYQLQDVDVLVNATAAKGGLSVDDGALIAVGKGSQTVDHLTIDGSNTTNFTVAFQDAEAQAGTHINVTNKAELNSGSVGVAANFDALTSNLLERDSATLSSTVITAGDLSFNDATFTLANTTATGDIDQGSGSVATATYTMNLAKSADDKSLNVEAKLSGVEILSGKELELNGFGAGDTEFETAISGAGALKIGGPEEITLSGNNTYTGNTVVEAGAKLIAGAENALGTTSELKLVAEATTDAGDGGQFNLKGNKQTVGALNAEVGSTLDLGTGGELTIAGTADSSSQGTLTGSGILNVAGDKTLTVNGENTGLTATVNVKETAKVKANHVGALGAGAVDIASNAELKIDLAAAADTAQAFANTLTGDGTFSFNGDETATGKTELAFGQDNAGFTGTVNLENAKFALQTGNNAETLKSTTVNVGNNTDFSIVGDQQVKTLNLEGGTLNFGNVSLSDSHANADNFLTATDELNLNSGKVKAALNAANVTGAKLLEHDVDGAISAKVATSGATTLDPVVTKDFGTVSYASGNVLNSDGEAVALAYYLHSLEQNGNDIAIKGKLTKVKITNGKTLEIDGDAATDKTLTAFVYDEGAEVGNVAITGGEVTLSNVNNAYKGKTSVAAGAKLKAGTNDALGSATRHTSELNLAAESAAGAGNGGSFDLNGKTQTIGALKTGAGSSLDLNDGTLTIAGASASEVIGSLTGTDKATLNLEGSTLGVWSSNGGLTANVNVNNDAGVWTNKTDGLGSASINVDTDAKFGILLEQADATKQVVNNTLSGTGEVHLDGDYGNKTGQTEFEFAKDNSGFTGTYHLTNVKYALSDTSDKSVLNTTALKNAVTNVHEGTEITVGAGTQELKTLNLMGGTLDFGNVAVTKNGDLAANNINATDTLNLTKGTIKANVNTDVTDTDTVGILDLDDAGLQATLAKAANALTLDPSVTLSQSTKQGNIVQGGETVAEGDFGLNLTAENKELKVKSLLTKLNLLVDKTLVIDRSKADDDTLSAQLTGKGSVKVQGGEVKFSNGANDYTGNTTVAKDSALTALANGVLGNTAKLILEAKADGVIGGVFNLNGHQQTIGALDGAERSALSLDGGTLTISGEKAPSVMKGELVGSGQLNINKNEFVITTANDTFSADVNIGADNFTKAWVNANHIDALGKGDVTISELSQYNVTLAEAPTTGTAELKNKLLGKGQFNFTGTGADTTKLDLGDANKNGDFEGMVGLSKTAFDLVDHNTSALSKATLKASTGSVVNVGDGKAKNPGDEQTQTIKHLTVDGGLVNFGKTTLASQSPVKAADNNLAVNSMDITVNDGEVHVDAWADDNTGLIGGVALLEQDDHGALRARLATSATAVGTLKTKTGADGEVTNLSLVDADGNAQTEVKQNLLQGSKMVARASYDTYLEAAEGKTALDVAYKLTTVELHGKDNEALLLSAPDGATDAARTLTAKLTNYVEGGDTVEGDLVIGGKSTIILNNKTNDYTGKTFVRSGATLQAGSNKALGNTSELNLAANATFDLNDKTQTVGAVTTAAGSELDIKGGILTVSGATASTVEGKLKGTAAGELKIQRNDFTVKGANADLASEVKIGINDANRAHVHADNIGALGTGKVAIRRGSSFNVAEGDGTKTLVNELFGRGDFNFKGNGANNTIFVFGDKNVNGNFKGRADLQDTTFNLTGNNTSALANAALRASSGAVVNVGDSLRKVVDGTQVAQNIRRFVFNGGLANFGETTLRSAATADVKVADNHLNVNTMNVTAAGGKVHVDAWADADGLIGGVALLEQDDHGALRARLATSANTITGLELDAAGKVTNLQLVDAAGKDQTVIKEELKQGGTMVARASYDTYLETANSQKALDVAYALTTVELHGKEEDGEALILTAKKDATEAARTLTAQLTDYVEAGVTTVGDLAITGDAEIILDNKNNNYTGKTTVKDTATLKAGSDNALGNTSELELADAGTKFLLNGKTQTVGALNTVAGSTVDVTGGTLVIAGVNATDVNQLDGELKGGSAIEYKSGHSQITHDNKALNATITIGDNDALTSVARVELVQQLRGLGNGAVQLKDDGVLDVVTDANGSLSNAKIWSAAADTGSEFIKRGIGQLTMSLAQVQYYGKTQLNQGSLLLDGTPDGTPGDTMKTHEINVAAGTTLIGINNVKVDGVVNNNHMFHIGHIPGSMTVDASTVTTMGYDGALASRLAFNGNLGNDASPFNKFIVKGNTSGQSILDINNVAGLGDFTVNGIKIIEVTGDSDAVFSLPGRLSAGAFDYSLNKKAKDWYLDSGLKPEVGVYIANVVAANNMFNPMARDRVGATGFAGPDSKPSLWMDLRYDRSSFEDNYGHLNNRYNSRSLMIGSDLIREVSANGSSFQLGAMAGYGSSSGKADNPVTGYNASGKLEGYALGVYGTYFANPVEQTGFHLDTWLLWNDYRAHVNGDGGRTRYKLRGMTAAVEAGYTFKFAGSASYDYYVQPKAQFAWLGIEPSTAVDPRGNTIKGTKAGLRTSLGVKAYMAPNSRGDATWKPYVELNWIHNTKPTAVTMAVTRVEQGGVSNIGEVKLGVERHVTKGASLWLHGSHQFGGKGYRNTGIKAGVKYNF